MTEISGKKQPLNPAEGLQRRRWWHPQCQLENRPTYGDQKLESLGGDVNRRHNKAIGAGRPGSSSTWISATEMNRSR